MDYRPKTILVAAGSEGFLTHITKVLNKMDFNVIPAGNGIRALGRIGQPLPDSVIFDIAMHRMDEAEALKYMKEDKRLSEIPVVIVYNNIDAHVYKTCVRLGYSDFLPKPLNLFDLNDVLQKHFVHSRGKRRKYLRALFGKDISLFCKGRTQEYHAVNLSMGGIYVHGKSHLPTGARVRIDLPLNNENILFLKGKVKHNKYLFRDASRTFTGGGIEFKDIPSDDSKHLKSYIIDLIEGIHEMPAEPLIMA